MDATVASQFLTSDGDEIAELKANLNLVEGFIGIAREINALPDVHRRFYEESRSLFQITAVNCDIKSLESILSKFFGLPVKPAGKALPRKLRKNASVKHLGGIQQDQSLFLLNLRTGQFYGTLWPWRRNKSKIEVHLGYCSDWMTDGDYKQLENFVTHEVNHDAFTQMGAAIGGQLRGISLPSFLQIAEMEKSSFALQISSHQKIGHLHIADGRLIAADYGGLTSSAAAAQVISWDDVTIEIEPLDASKRNEIEQPLMQLLMESLKIKEDNTGAPKKPPVPAKPSTKAPKSVAPAKRLVHLKRAPAPRKPRKKTNWMIVTVAAIGAAAVIAALSMAAMVMLHSNTQKEKYELLVTQVDAITDPQARKSRLQAYLKDNPKSAHIKAIHAKIESAQKAIEEKEFEAVTLKISALPVDDVYEKKAVELFEQFLEKYPNTRLMPQINQAINEIKNLIDQFYYEELKYAARLDFNERLTIYQQYLSRFPEGRYRKDVHHLIIDMGHKYLDFLASQESQCEQNKRWETCIEQYERFRDTYPSHALGQKAAAARDRLIAQRDYYKLNKAISDAGNDYLNILSLYKDYVTTHPRNPYQTEIDNAMQALNKQIHLQNKWIVVRRYAMDPGKDLFERIQRLDNYLRANRSSPYASDAESLMATLEEKRRNTLQAHRRNSQKLKQQAKAQRQREEMARRKVRVKRLSAQLNAQLSRSPRYHPNGDGTVLDHTTGLIWTLLDSEQELGGCLTYQAAQQYITNLNHGASNSWRLPTASELASILKRSPYYPSSGAQWYWSSEAYVKGFHAVADVVTAKNENVFQRDHRLQNECGAVRAVMSK